MNQPISAGTGAIDRLQLGMLVLDLGEGELRDADGHPAALRRQALQVLLTLGRRAGQVVSKDELMGAVDLPVRKREVPRPEDREGVRPPILVEGVRDRAAAGGRESGEGVREGESEPAHHVENTPGSPAGLS